MYFCVIAIWEIYAAYRYLADVVDNAYTCPLSIVLS